MLPITKTLIENIHPEWKVLLNGRSSDGRTIMDVLNDSVENVLKHKTEHNTKLCPSQPLMILRCLEMSPDDIKVIVLGQDSYPQPNVANGLAFSCKTNQPSVMIFERELQLEYKTDSTLDYTLEDWVKQGVLLLNTSLSCDEYKPCTHSEYWKPFMIELITSLNNLKVTQKDFQSLVFVSLGRQAQSFNYLINEGWHSIINRYHPAAETHGTLQFKGFFNEVNVRLQEQGREVIKWI